MLESQLKLGNDLTKDREVVKQQMKSMKDEIGNCSRNTSFITEDVKEAFDDFKQDLLNQCDKWVESQREKIDFKFSKI